jgi:uncharacterized membrane protein
MPRWLVPVGRTFFALGMIGIGIEHFFFREFIPVIATFPAAIPGRIFWVYLCGAALVAAGSAILLNIKARQVGIVLGAAFLVLLVLDHIPYRLANNPGILGFWGNEFKILTLAGGAWIAAGSLIQQRAEVRSADKLMSIGRYFLPITVTVFGFEHFLYTDFVATLVPAWIPWHNFWTYFAAVALMVAGIAMIVNIKARLASLMLGIMIFIWFLILHIPRAIADPTSAIGNEVASVFEALAFSGIAFMLCALPAWNPFAISAKESHAVSD